MRSNVRSRLRGIYTSRTVDGSPGLRPSTLQALLAHGTAGERRLDSILTQYRVNLKTFHHHIAIRERGIPSWTLAAVTKLSFQMANVSH